MLNAIFMSLKKVHETVLVFFLLPLSSLAEVKVEVVDQYGKPVSLAVVSTPLRIPKALSEAKTLKVMDQLNKQFSPKVLIVDRGDWVSFPNSDDIRHHVYSFSEVKPFEIRLYKGKQVDPINFDKSGVVILGCNIHDKMMGYIYVIDNEAAAITDINGVAKLNSLSKYFYIWHPRLSIKQTARQRFNVESTEKIKRVTISLAPEISLTKKRQFRLRNPIQESK